MFCVLGIGGAHDSGSSDDSEVARGSGDDDDVVAAVSKENAASLE